MIDGWEVPDDIDAQDVAISPGEELQPVDGFVSPFADPIGIRVGDEPALEDRLDHVAEGVMNNAVGERRGADLSLLGIMDHEVDVAAGLVAEVGQLILQLQEPVGDLMLEPGGGRFAAFAPGRQPVGQQEVRPVDHL